jgi:hypothetical protein
MHALSIQFGLQVMVRTLCSHTLLSSVNGHLANRGPILGCDNVDRCFERKNDELKSSKAFRATSDMLPKRNVCPFRPLGGAILAAIWQHDAEV